MNTELHFVRCVYFTTLREQEEHEENEKLLSIHDFLLRYEGTLFPCLNNRTYPEIITFDEIRLADVLT